MVFDRYTLKAHFFLAFYCFVFGGEGTSLLIGGTLSLIPSRLLDKHQTVTSFSPKAEKTQGGFSMPACKVPQG